MLARESTGDRRSTWEGHETVERLCATLERAPIGIAHVDVNGRWQLANRCLSEILGYRQDELLAGSLESELGVNLAEAEQALRVQRRPFETERRYTRKDREVVWCHITISPVIDDAW